MRLGGIYISVGAKTDKLKRDLAKAKTMTQKAAVHMKNAIKSINFRAIGVGVAAFSAAYVFAMKKAIDAASDLQEVQGKFDVVFEDHKKQAEDMAKVLVDAYAMSEREAKQYMSSVQDLLVPMGMASDEAIIMSDAVVKLSADLGSFNNLPTAQVMADIQSGLVGNFETMKKYGVVLNETVVKQKALSLGLYSGKGLLDANTKAGVAFKLMLEGSAAAIGDQERTMGSYANQMKLLKANIEGVAAAIGTALLPQVTEWVKQLNVMIKKHPEVIDQLAEFAENSLKIATALGKAAQAAAYIFSGKAGEDLYDWADAARIAKQETNNLADAMKRVKELRAGARTADGYVSITTPKGIAGAGLAGTVKAGSPAAAEMTATAARLKVMKEFNTQYAAIGKSRFDLEREEILKQAKLWEQHGIDKTKNAKLTSAKMKAIDKAESQQRMDTIQSVTGMMADNFKMISEMGGKHSKEAFRAYKAFKIIETMISTRAGAVKAYESMLTLGPAGPALGAAAAAAVIAFGAMQVKMIRASEPPSYDQGGISRAAGLYQTGNINEAHIPLKGGKVPVKMSGGQGSPQVFNVILNNPTFQDVATQRRVFAQIAEIVARRVAPKAVIDNYNNDQGVRSMVRGGA